MLCSWRRGTAGLLAPSLPALLASGTDATPLPHATCHFNTVIIVTIACLLFLLLLLLTVPISRVAGVVMMFVSILI